MSEKKLSVLKNVDVAVIGGGLAGCAAAIAAARKGAKTLLVESSGILGGAATGGLVAPISSIASKTGKTRFGGILWEVIDKVIDYSKKYCGSNAYHQLALHMYKYVLLQMAHEAGVELLFHTFLADTVSRADGSIDYAVVATKAGLAKIKAKIFIDTTGDGDLMGKSNADTIIGSEPNVLSNLVDDNGELQADTPFTVTKDDYVGQLQPVSLMMLFGGVDIKTAQPYTNKKLTYADIGTTREEFAKWEFCGTPGFEPTDSELVPMPQGRVWVHPSARENEAVINMSRVIGINACDPESYASAEVTAGLQLIALIDFLLRFIPGFEKAYFIESSSTLGVRESRRLIGNYVLSGRDVINCVSFDDAVAYGSYIIDIHDPTGKRMAIGGQVKKDYYAIPYRCLVTDKVPNLATAGRSISADHVAMSSTRIQGTAMLTGQAVGTAAAIALKTGCTMPQVPTDQLRRQLKDDGVFISGNL